MKAEGLYPASRKRHVSFLRFWILDEITVHGNVSGETFLATQLRTLAVFLVVFLFCASCRNDEDQGEQGGARLFSQKLEFDFGTVFSGAVKNATFVLENRGDTDLVILRAQKDCGCTKPSFSRRTLGPGESGTMTVTLVAPDFHGTMSKRIRVYTNDRDHEVTVFRLTMNGMGRANVSPVAIEVSPSSFDPSGNLVFPLTLELPPGQPILQVRANADSPFLEAEIREGRGTSRATIDLSIRGLREERLFRDYVLLDVTTKNRSGKQVIVQPQGIQVKGKIEPKISVQPSLIDMGFVASGSHQTIQLGLVGGGDVKINSVLIHEEGVLKSLSSRKEGHLVYETCSVEGSPGRLFAQARVQLSNGKTLEVPILGWVEH